ncbi:MAG: hypothetical protein V1646_01535 [bacterium]
MRVFNFTLICTAIIFIFSDFNFMHCMEGGTGTAEHVTVDVEMGVPTDGDSHDITPVRVTDGKKTESVGVVVELGREKFNTFRLQQYYHVETKTLDLSHKPMGDKGLRAIFDHIRHFISENDTEILLLESMNLTEVPYYLVTFALVDKHLRVVSFQNNRFNIPGLPVLEEAAAASTSGSVRLSVNTGKRDSKRASIPAFQIGQDAAAVPRLTGNVGAVAQMVTTLWDNFSPQIARELEEQKLSSEIVPLFKKIIFIDKRIPPITVFDQTQTVVAQSPSKCQKFKYAVERVLYTMAGSIIGFLPQIITLCTSGGSDSDKCDMDMLEKMMAACNVTATREIKTDSQKSDNEMLQKLVPVNSSSTK